MIRSYGRMSVMDTGGLKAAAPVPRPSAEAIALNEQVKKLREIINTKHLKSSNQSNLLAEEDETPTSSQVPTNNKHSWGISPSPARNTQKVPMI